MQYLLQSHSQSDVSRCHRGDLNMLIRERHQQPAHPLTTHNVTHKNKLLTFHSHDFGKNWLEVNDIDVHAVPVDVVDGRLWFQSTGVNPKKHQRTALLVMENLEGQSTQVVLVPPPVGWLTECE